MAKLINPSTPPEVVAALINYQATVMATASAQGLFGMGDLVARADGSINDILRDFTESSADSDAKVLRSIRQACRDVLDTPSPNEDRQLFAAEILKMIGDSA